MLAGVLTMAAPRFTVRSLMIVIALLALSIAAGRFLIQWHERRAYEGGLAAERAALAAVRTRVATTNTSKPMLPVLTPTLVPSVPK
jgi:hypothetical protein